MKNNKMWEVQQDSNNYISPNLYPTGFDLFLKDVLSKFKKEIELVGQTYYAYDPEEKHEYLGHEDIFTINERAWVGLFNNALIRMNPEVVTMQEFGVWNTDKGSAGRCDFLFQYTHNGKVYDIITETKSFKFCNDWDKDDPEFYFDIFEQGQKYFISEQKYYTNQVIILSLVFEWIDGNMMVTNAKEIMKKWHDGSDPETGFVALYHGKQRGVFVYGNTKSINNLNSTI